MASTYQKFTVSPKNFWEVPRGQGVNISYCYPVFFFNFDFLSTFGPLTFLECNKFPFLNSLLIKNSRHTTAYCVLCIAYCLLLC